VAAIIRTAIPWDVMGGVARRAWARNEGSIETCIDYNASPTGSDHITLPYLADDGMVADAVAHYFK
jgi:urocanate hydratase